MTQSSEPPRRPQVFEVDDPNVEADGEAAGGPGRAEPADPVDPADAAAAAAPPSLAQSTRQGLRWGALLVSAMVGLALLAAGVWFARFVSVAMARDDWIGWTAQGLAGLAAIAAAMLILKEVFGVLRLRRLSRVRADAERARDSGERGLEEAAVRRLKALIGRRAEAKWDLARFREEERHMREPGQLLAHADKVLLSGSDRQARRVVYESARRVGVVTAVVPVAFLVVLFVLFENIRMVRRLADAYGGRPGALGGFRLLWRVIAHIAATGAVALTDDLFGQFLGQDIVRRVSRRLGEGAFNAALTARLGVVAAELCRPLPHVATTPLRARSIIRELFPDLSPSALAGQAFGGRRKAAV